MEWDLVSDIVGGIPEGHWMSYGDVVAVCGGTTHHARALNRHLIRHEIEGAHRVLKGDGTVGGTALGDPVKVRRRLAKEGLDFDGAKANPERRIRPEVAAAA